MSKVLFPLKKMLRNNLRPQKFIITPAVSLGLILLLGTALRFYNLGTESYWIDEMFTVIQGNQSVHQLLASGRLDQPPGYYLPFMFWIQLFGDAEVGTRSFSALAGIGSIILIYLIGRELFGKSVGLLSAFLMAVTEFQIHYSQSNRFYSFFECMTLFSFLFFILALRSKKNIYFFLYGLASIIMVYGHTFGIFVLVAQNLFFFIQAFKNRNVIANWLICQALIALAILPYLGPLLFGSGGIRGAVERNLTGINALSIWDPIHFIFGFVLGHRHGRGWASVLVSFAAAGVFLVIGSWLCALRGGKNLFRTIAKSWAADIPNLPDLKNKFLLLGCWLLCPLVLPLIASLAINRAMYEEHYTISAAPAVYLLLAFGLFSIRKLIPLAISLGTLLIMILPGLGYYYATNINEQWREVAAYIEQNSEQDEVIIFAPNMIDSDMDIGIQQLSFNWYYRGGLPSCGLSNYLTNPEEMSGALELCTSEYYRYWVIIPDYATVLSDDRYRSFFQSSGHPGVVLKEHQFVGLSVYLFEKFK